MTGALAFSISSPLIERRYSKLHHYHSVNLMMTELKQFLSGRAFTGLVFRIVAVVAVITVVTEVYFSVIRVNATTVALSYLLVVLVCAARWGLVESITASIVAVLCFNFFFLPPLLTFTIADPQNWMALFAFLSTSIIASQLSNRAKHRAQEALARQNEMEKLYAVSRAILLIEPDQHAGKQIAYSIAQAFGLRAVTLLDRVKQETLRAGPEDLIEADDWLREAAIQGTFFHDRSKQLTVTAVRLGGEPIGALAICGATLSDTALQALSNLAAISFEKVRAQQAASRAEAARQSQELKSTLLDAVAHEFKTPLTSIKAATTALLSESVAKPEERQELLTVVDEETDHMERLVSDAIQTARIEAGRIQLYKKLQSFEELLRSVLSEMKPQTEGRPVTVAIPPSLPLVMMDTDLIELAVRQLIDNALKYSPASSSVEIAAETTGVSLSIKVCDRGPGIPEEERARIFEKFYRIENGQKRIPGSGVGLAIAHQIAEAHLGLITVESRPGGGSVFSLSIPLDPERVTV